MEKIHITPCDPCQDKFEKNVSKIVHEAKPPTPKAHEDKKKEVTAAFHTDEKGKK